MACSAPTTIISSNPNSFSTKSVIPSNQFSQTLSIPKSFNGLRKPFQSRAFRSISIRSSSSRRSFVVNASAELPLVGNVAPDFEAEAVFDQEFVKVKLSEYIGKKYVILFFYPLDFTFVCPTEITAFSDRHGEFEKLNTEILGVSVDSVFSHLAWVQTDRKSGGLGDLKYPLVSDVTKSISKSYGVLIHDQGIALRGLFIIDKEGVIQHSTINNLAIGRSVDETMRTLQQSNSTCGGHNVLPLVYCLIVAVPILSMKTRMLAPIAVYQKFSIHLNNERKPALSCLLQCIKP
ncbi:hypothetical protein GIB67_042082 [Kingdonia uniflora]|uniref:thioredoxin-dependent peroxiredoxin n=1 Tax=Kingdonia uniflora TaxID=39325 RepID=A0A7J7MVQ1_9MAGN|nr:hypothetical protein GIB67_042082 [Kingdonia uniflora]